jgi:hypothetical protein
MYLKSKYFKNFALSGSEHRRSPTTFCEVLFRVLSQLELFYFILSEARKEPEDLPASVGGVAVLLPLVFIYFFCFNFSFTFF